MDRLVPERKSMIQRFEPGTRKPHPALPSLMATELVRECPSCESEQEFYLTASTELHLGKKTKWVCPACEFRFVKIDGDIDSSVSSA